MTVCGFKRLSDAPPLSGWLRIVRLHDIGDGLGTAQPPDPLHEFRWGRNCAPARKFLGHRLQMSWPYIPRLGEEVPAGLGFIQEKLREAAPALARVAGPAGGY